MICKPDGFMTQDIETPTPLRSTNQKNPDRAKTARRPQAHGRAAELAHAEDHLHGSTVSVRNHQRQRQGEEYSRATTYVG